MTIQAVINNRGSMILCTDLRQTIEEFKSYVGVKKIFELKDEKPYGIMINGAMDFEGVPLETLIGEFKRHLKELDDAEKIKEDLIDFLGKNTPHTSSAEYLSQLIPSFKARMQKLIMEDGFRYAVNDQTTQEIPEFLKDYPGFDHEFHDLIPDKYNKEEYNLKIWAIFSYELNYYGSQIIIAGYDEKDHYGSLFVFNIYCNDYGKIISIDIESLVNCEEPYIRVYAMNEEAYAFITGVSSDFENYIKNYIKDTNQDILENMEWYFDEKNFENKKEIIDALKKQFKIYYSTLNNKIDNFRLDMIKYTSNSCEYVPRQLLCDFADSLIKLTALKQKLSLDLETVSSESDIVLITKTDNFKWVKCNDEIL